MKIKIIVPLLVCTVALILFTKYKIVIGMGDSMQPTYPRFKILLCKKQKEYQIDDVISYKLDTHKVVHRITAIIDDGVVIQYQTKGDGNKTTDRYLITKTNIECKIIWKKIGGNNAR